MNLNERVKELEEQVTALTSKLMDVSKNVEEKYKKPITKIGGNRDRSLIRSVDVGTGLGQMMGGSIPWNDSELKIPPINKEPDAPTKGYNKHSHSEFSGGALIKDVLQIVEYDWDSVSPAITNKHSQQYGKYPDLKIATEVNSNGQTKDKIGILDLIFNPDILKWGVASYEIDIKKCYLVERDDDGNIVVDDKGQEKKALLYNEDQTKTSIIWDENGGVWRFYSVYADGN